MAVASHDVAIVELYNAVKLILGNVCTIKTILTKDVKDDKEADLYICGITQIDQLAQVVPREKIILFKLRFTSQFFIQVARIPAGENVYIISPHMMLVKLLIQSFYNLGIKEINFLPIDMETMSQEEIIARLKKAKYLIGVEDTFQAITKPGMKYAKYINKEVKIIGGKRVASMESACRLIQWVAESLNKLASQKVTIAAHKLNSSPVISQDCKLSATIHDIDKIMMENTDSLFKMREVIMKSFANQISTNISINDDELKISNYHPLESAQDLDHVKGLSNNLSNIANKISGLK